MAREYVVSGAGITVAAAAVTLVFINPVAGTAIEILRCWVSQSGSTTSAQQRVQLNTQVTAFPTLTSATPAKTKTGDPASGIVGGTAGAQGTCGINASAEGGGAKTIILQDSFNVLNGWLWVPTPRETIIIRAAETTGFALHLPVSVSTTANWQFGVTYAELG